MSKISDVILNGLVRLGKIPSNFLPQLDVTLLFAFRKVDSICFSEPEIRIDIGSNQMKGKTERFSSLLTNFCSWIHFPQVFVKQIRREINCKQTKCKPGFSYHLVTKMARIISRKQMILFLYLANIVHKSSTMHLRTNEALKSEQAIGLNDKGCSLAVRRLPIHNDRKKGLSQMYYPRSNLFFWGSSMKLAFDTKMIVP